MAFSSTERSLPELQRVFAERHPEVGIFEPESGTIVVLPSLTLPEDELRKVTGIQFYEERLLFLLLTLRRPGVRVVYLTSVPVDPAIIEYHLSFLPDPEDARQRLHLLPLDDSAPRPLTVKLLERPRVIERARAVVGQISDAWLLPFNVTASERKLAERVGLPLYGPEPELIALGSKSGSRQVARAAGVPVADGFEDLWTTEQVQEAVECLVAREPRVRTVILKLNDGFSGLGNAVVDVLDPPGPIVQAPTRFGATDESWPSYAAKIAQRGVVIEEFLQAPGIAMPSVLFRITPGGTSRVVATHDQILGGPCNQVYLGCRFPADARYRAAIQDCAGQVARVLAQRGVIGFFGVDFFVLPSPSGEQVLLCEINLRLGGTTHPFGMTLLATGATYAQASGELVAEGVAKSYLATDNLESGGLIGRRPGDVIAMVERRGLGFDTRTRTGTTLHMLGAVQRFGKMGFTCIGDSVEQADELYQAMLRELGSADTRRALQIPRPTIHPGASRQPGF
jgi:PGM1 C-terminal domain/ATP-grasp domain